MMLCLVTDRRRLGAAIGARPGEFIDALEAQVVAAARAGVDLVQVREPDLEAAHLTALVRSITFKCRDTAAKILVNDRFDVALAAKAAGVQLKESSFSPDDARRLASRGFLIGCSVHTPLTAIARRSADFLIAGTVKPTVSKQPAEYLDWKGLEIVIGAAAGTPVLGIGGLDLSSIPMLAASGAAGLAAVGAFIPTVGQAPIEFVKKRVIDMRFAFDSARGYP
jgi:thiamine-phosphate pyrophosphorylase